MIQLAGLEHMQYVSFVISVSTAAAAMGCTGSHSRCSRAIVLGEAIKISTVNYAESYRVPVCTNLYWV